MTDPYYDVTGHGPVLLLIPGGAGHPMGLGPPTEVLAEHFTVVTYDPLGLAHGRLGLPVEDQRPQDWSDGARRVLEATLPEGESAYVYGTIAAGTDSRGQLLYRTSEFLAKALNGDFVEFPGGHLGVLQHPVPFAERLRETLLHGTGASAL